MSATGQKRDRSQYTAHVRARGPHPAYPERAPVVDDAVPLSHAVIETTVQFAYTSLFGAFASYSFCRTHRLSAPVAAHVLCNYLGLPEFACLRPGPLYDYRLAFLALHVAGIALFFTRSGWLLSSSESVLWA